MRSVYLRPFGFVYGKDAKYLIDKKLALRLSGSKNIAFTKLEIIKKKSKKIISVTQIAKLSIVEKRETKEDLERIQKKRNSIFNLNFNKPIIMGILNMTPDSFSDGGKYNKMKKALRHVKKMIKDGAKIIDVGGESTRPGAKLISVEKEIGRVFNIIKKINKFKKSIISIDTRKSLVMKKAVQGGAKIINDVSALDFDLNSENMVIKLKKPIILNHSQGTPITMQRNPSYENVLIDIYDYFENKIKKLEKKGILRKNIILDPGIGFGKNVMHNLNLINKISFFHSLGCLLMLGPSRKSFIGKIMGNKDSKYRLGGTISSVIIGANQGVQFFRVHDIKELNEALTINQALHKN